MNTFNKLLFENLDDRHYTSMEAAVKEYPVFRHSFQDILGFNEQTGGYVALQKGHQREALLGELPTAAVLKTCGYAVVLLSEVGNNKHPDALIDDVVSEFKQVRKLTIRALKDDFYESRKKSATRIVLEITDASERDTLFELLKRIAHNPMVNGLQDVFLETVLKPHALFLALLERRARKDFLRGERVFEDKNRRFLSSKTRSPR